jgi:hypothetical protein
MPPTADNLRLLGVYMKNCPEWIVAEQVRQLATTPLAASEARCCPPHQGPRWPCSLGPRLNCQPVAGVLHVPRGDGAAV